MKIDVKDDPTFHMDLINSPTAIEKINDHSERSRKITESEAMSIKKTVLGLLLLFNFFYAFAVLRILSISDVI